jgi:uncharacterized membrane protein YgcG
MVVELSSLKNKFYTTSQSIQKLLPKSLTEKGYFVANPLGAGAVMHIVAVFLMFAAFVVHSWMSIGLGLAAAIVFVLALLMPKRSAKGVAAEDAIKGLKLYLETAEADRINMLQSPDAPYVPKSGEPVRTVELYEKLLPFAIVLGVENAWSKQFESIYATSPEWYSGNWTTFNTIYLLHGINGSLTAMNTSFAPPSNSGSSGFGGGGFSGGGGGGGGGGGW